jgi:hypothetical protein
VRVLTPPQMFTAATVGRQVRCGQCDDEPPRLRNVREVRAMTIGLGMT